LTFDLETGTTAVAGKKPEAIAEDAKEEEDDE
jgi:hypothetical protein